MGNDVRMFARPETTQEAVLAELRNSIVSGTWRPGEPIRQGSLATRFGVSRVPVREALKILEGEGLVEYRAHRGYVVSLLDAEELSEVYALRRLLEGEAVRRALPNISSEHLDRMREAMRRMEEADPDDVLTLTQANREFHFAIFDAAGGKRLRNLIRILWDATGPYRAVYYRDVITPDVLARVNEAHRAIFAALSGGAPKKEVVRLLDEHREGAFDKVLSVVNPEDEPA